MNRTMLNRTMLNRTTANPTTSNHSTANGARPQRGSAVTILRRVAATGLSVSACALLAVSPAGASPLAAQQTDPAPLPVGFVDVCLLPFSNIIIGGPGDDVLVGTARNDLILGLGGNDQIAGGGGRDSIYGGSGRDLMMGDAGDDCIIGGAGRDVAVRWTFVPQGTDDVREVEARYEY